MSNRDNDTIRRLQAENERLTRALYVRRDFHPDEDQDDDDAYRPGCGADDTRDSRGERLLSRFNDAGEPRW